MIGTSPSASASSSAIDAVHFQFIIPEQQRLPAKLSIFVRGQTHARKVYTILNIVNILTTTLLVNYRNLPMINNMIIYNNRDKIIIIKRRKVVKKCTKE